MRDRQTIISDSHRPVQNGNSLFVTNRRPIFGNIIVYIVLCLLIAAFVPLAQGSDFSEGLTLRRAYRISFLALSTFLLLMGSLIGGFVKIPLKYPPFLTVAVFSGWAFVTSLWSPNPVLSAIKSVELISLAVLAVFFISSARTTIDSSKAFASVLAISFVIVGAALLLFNSAVYGTALPFTSVSMRLLSTRLHFAYAHPLATADFLGLALIAAFASGLRIPTKLILFPVLLFLFILTNTRAPSVGLFMALTAMSYLKLRGKDNRLMFVSMVISIVSIGYLIYATFFEENLNWLVEALLTEDVYSINSRVPLWAYSLQRSLEQPLSGYGYHSSRYILKQTFPFAGDAHNSFVDIFLTTGLVGFLLFAFFAVYTMYIVYKSGNVLLAGVSIYSLVHAMTDHILFVAELPMLITLLCLIQVTQERPDMPWHTKKAVPVSL